MDARVEDLDKLTGAPLRRWSIPSIDSLMGDVAIPYWGNVFWALRRKRAEWNDQATSAVLRLDSAAGDLTTAIAGISRHVVGAGVAPCK